MFNIMPVDMILNFDSNCASMLVKTGSYNHDHDFSSEMLFQKLYPHHYFPWKSCSPTYANSMAAVVNTVFSLFPGRSSNMLAETLKNGRI